MLAPLERPRRPPRDDPRGPDAVTRSQPETFQPIAAALAFALPGLGYAWLGETRRALTFGAAVLALIAAGCLIGGLDVVDRVNDRWWFLPQAGAGPIVFVIDAVRARLGAATSVARVNEVGTLYVVMAGMLNAIAVVDCLWRRAPAPERTRTP
jgi:hypothetical protein